MTVERRSSSALFYSCNIYRSGFASIGETFALCRIQVTFQGSFREAFCGKDNTNKTQKVKQNVPARLMCLFMLHLWRDLCEKKTLTCKIFKQIKNLRIDKWLNYFPSQNLDKTKEAQEKSNEFK